MIKFEKVPSDVLSRLPEAERALSLDDNVIFAYLFGGAASGKITPLSDIDIAVYVRDTGNMAEYKLDLFDRLSEALGTTEVDLVILNQASTSIAGRVLGSRRILVDKEPFERHRYESLVLREFFDFKVKEDDLYYRRYGIGR
jgi:predicted nucleotidyltransferase